MGMLDQKEYLTGTDGKGLVRTGDVFKITDAGIGGTVTIQGRPQQEVWLRIILPDGSEHLAYTTGTAIVGQVQRMDSKDREKMSLGEFYAKLGTVDTGKGNPANILEDPNSVG